ncbi:hypothetical protein [Halobacterium noricense]|uniref:hypothetical protein n=1 Tax=Halobacterium noricense TaxID=223182 RepID=UPI001E3EBC2C|nr:hypothetical protein [Halobacterium noricense]UHH25617.1 hypothetical protein LT974_01435 [Halobacterium noricense]
MTDSDSVENSSEVYWRIESDDEYIETWAEDDQVVALDTRHELSSYGDSEEDAITNLQEAVKEYLVLKYIRKNEPVAVQEIEESLNMGMRDLVGTLDPLFKKGELFEPRRDKLRYVPDE